MNRFAYHQPKSLEEAGRILSRGKPAAAALAGGTDLLGLIKDEIILPGDVVNLKGIDGLDRIAYRPGEGLTIGALATIAKVAGNEAVRRSYTVLAEAASEIASPQLRNVGTVGGNLTQRPRCWYFRGDFPCAKKGGDTCFAFEGRNKFHCIIGGGPCYIVFPSDLAVALLALDAEVVIHSPDGSRRAALRDFYVLPEDDETRETILDPGEIVTGIHVGDLPSGIRSGYVKFKERGAWDFALASVAAVIVTGGGKIAGGRVAFGGVAPVPWEEPELNEKLAGLAAKGKSIQALAVEALKEAVPLKENSFKLPLARNLLTSLLERLAG